MSGAPLDADLLVAGGGPAGLACAIEAALVGLSVKVIEPRVGIIDKACGEGLMPRAVRLLEGMGAAPARYRPISGVTYLDAVAPGPGGAARFAGGAVGWGVRRTDLHEALLQRAASLGVGWVEGKASAIEQRGAGDAEGRVRVETTAGALGGRWLAVADGLRSPLRAHLGLQGGPPRWRRMGMVRHFALAPWTTQVEVYWSPNVEAYVTPVADDEVGVALLFEGKGRFDDMLRRECPALWARIEGAEPLGPVKGGGPFDQRVRRRALGQVALVGDAAGFLDPITGEGVRLGLEGARALAACLADGHLRGYERAWRDATARYYRMTGALLAVARRPRLRRLILPVVRRCPWVMSLAVRRLSADDAPPTALIRE